jgi:hypothetical protein
MDPNNLTAKDVLLATAPTVALIIGLLLLGRGENLWAAIVLIPTAMIFIYSFMNLPFRELAIKEHEKELRQKQTIVGRVWIFTKRTFDFIGTIVFLVVLFIIGRRIFNGLS